MTGRTAKLAEKITKASSRQSYITAKWMVDQDLENDCYRAYSYFRWVDDVVDEVLSTREARLAFIRRQEDLVAALYRGEVPDDLSPEETILTDLIRNERGHCGLLRSYVVHFLAIIAFDARRKGRGISQRELDWYAAALGRAVTDGIQYFICNGHPYPDSKDRYLAATAAHITHMLRDMKADLPEGYINIPVEVVAKNGSDPADWDDEIMKDWVRGRVALARDYFRRGKRYLDSLEVLRCKIVGYWYCARFESILDRIEADDYVLLPVYTKPPKLLTWSRYLALAAWIALRHGLQTLARKTCGRARMPEVESPRLDLSLE